MRDDLMVQQQVANTWQHMVGVICLNQTNRKQVKAVLPKLFKKWATHTELLSSATIASLEKILKPLGMQKKKAERARNRQPTAGETESKPSGRVPAEYCP